MAVFYHFGKIIRVKEMGVRKGMHQFLHAHIPALAHLIVQTNLNTITSASQASDFREVGCEAWLRDRRREDEDQKV